MKGAAWALAASLLGAAEAAAQTSPFCPPYASSPIHRPRTRQVPANPSNWIGLIEGALDGDEILLADGVYNLDQYAVQITKQITVRGASGNRAAVLIQGQGYGVGSEGFMVEAPNVTIADLSMTAIRNHAISIKGELGAQAPNVYNVHLYDVGTQHIKGTPGSGVNNGVVACSRIGYSTVGAQGDYINAIDIHHGIDWTVRDNEIYNIWGDGTGCEVDVSCATYLSGGGPAILIWNNSSGTVIERNRIVDSFMGIAVGYGTPHPGGIVRNNFVYRSQASRPGARGTITGDLGIHVRGGNGTTVDHNTVIQAGTYPGAVEIWQSQNVAVRNSLISQPVWDRGGNTGLSLQGNKTNGAVSDLAVPFDPHLAAGSGAVDFATTVSLPGVPDDIDGDARPQGVRRDAGCDEWMACAAPASNLSFYSLIPCRLVDTRRAAGPLGGPPLDSGVARTFDLNQSCSVPATAKALVLNVTVTGSTAGGHVALGPGGCAVPSTSTVNFPAGQTRANNAIVGLDGTGNLVAFALMSGGASVHLILDVSGYFQ
jgi:parallel beta helix pectate lyase-like protein